MIDGAGGQIELRLVVQLQLALLDGLPQLAGHGQALGTVLVAPFVVHGDSVQGAFGQIHGHIRAAQ